MNTFKIITTFVAALFCLATSTSIEAKHHSHFSMNVNVGNPYVRPAYIVQAPTTVVVPAQPVVVAQQTPVYVQQPAVPNTVIVATPYYATPAYVAPQPYVVPAQTVVVSKVRPRPSIGFSWGFFFR